MCYISNSPCDFEFHDTEFWDGNVSECRFIANVKFLNIHSNAEPNPFDKDMEIEQAQIVFDGFYIISYEHGRVWKTDENGERYTDEPQVILQGDKAAQAFKEQLNDKIVIFDFDKKDDTAHFIDAMGNDPFFTLLFSFDSVTVSWDAYKKTAWYAK